MQHVLGLILGGGRGERLYPLTKHRSEPAVPLAGKYRLIDIPLSNCINSGVRRVYVLTQFQSVSLHRHISNTYKFDPFGTSFVEVLAAQQTNETAYWFQGTADALRQNLLYIREEEARDVLLLYGDQLYRMDFARLVEAHRWSKADVTFAGIPVDRSQASRLGILCCDGDRITRLVEKPQTEEELEELRTPAQWFEDREINPRGREFLANMGIYVFSRDVLDELLGNHPQAIDLVREIFPKGLVSHRFQVYPFDGYWDDLGSIKSYHEAHMALASDNPPFDFASVEGIIYTRMRNLPASQIYDAQVEQCLVSDGCVVQTGCRLERCVIGVRSLIGPNVTLRDTVLNGAESYETEEERAASKHQGLPTVGIGENTIIERAIVDKSCRIGRNVRILNQKGLRDYEGPDYAIHDGIVILPKGTVLRDGTVI